MGDHADYWSERTRAGEAVVFGPVADPAGAYGFAVVRAGTEEDVLAMSRHDPAVTSGTARCEVYEMPGAVVG